jgi:hypothetical protein
MNYLSTVQYGTKQVSLLDCFLYATIDPGGGTSAANATSKTDKVGWVVGAATLNSDYIILDFGEEYMEITELVSLIYKIHSRWKPQLIGVERMMYLQQYLLSEMQRKGKILDIFTLSHKGRSKPERIKAFMPFLKQTYFLDGIVNAVQKSLSKWHEKLLHGDDGIDALAYFYDVALAPTLNDLTSSKRERQRWEQEARLESLDPRSRREAESIARKYDRQYFVDDFTD